MYTLKLMATYVQTSGSKTEFNFMHSWCFAGHSASKKACIATTKAHHFAYNVNSPIKTSVCSARFINIECH